MNQDFPLITVLMPCKDPKVSFFREALNSVFSQTTPLWNLILVDDHSRDKEIIGILRELGNANDVKVAVLKNGSNLITGALNTGMRYAKTPYVCSLHCDDLLDENAIEVLNTYISEYPDIDYFHSSRVHIDEGGYPVGSVKGVKESFNLSDFKKYDAPVKHLHCWKVESALAIGGMDESLGLHGADDYDFPWRMAEAGCSFKAEKCLEIEKERIKANWSPSYFLKDLGFYYKQVNAYIENFSQVKIYLYDDLRKYALDVIKDIYEFLEVDPSFVPDISIKYNTSSIPRIRVLQKLLVEYKPLKKTLRPLFLNAIGKEKTEKLIDYFKDKNSKKINMEPETRRYLVEIYRDDILMLQGLIKRDLSDWLR